MDTLNLRVIHLAGPGDVASVLRTKADGKQFDEISHVAYSGLAFETCERLGCSLLSLSTHSRADDFSFGQLRAVNIGDPLKGKSGASYHLAHLTFAKILRKFVQETKADVVITGLEPHPFLIADLAKKGVSLVPALHTTLRPQFRPQGRGAALATRLNRRFFSNTCTAILSHPGWAVEQLMDLTGKRTRPIVEFLPLLRQDAFSDVAPPIVDAKVFRVMMLGRVERDKGVFSLLQIAAACVARLGTTIRFDVCGTGSALEEARRRVTEMGLQDVVTLHGWTPMPDLVRLWGDSHVAIVPTTKDFTEGFNQVVIEAVLAGRPVITSQVCPSLEFVRPCAVEVEVDDIDGYVAAIIRLAEDRSDYARLQEPTQTVIRPFLDPRNSFGAGIEHVLRAIAAGRAVAPISHPPAF
jgi:glycogen synthase